MTPGWGETPRAVTDAHLRCCSFTLAIVQIKKFPARNLLYSALYGTLKGMECIKPTKKFPEGRTGTDAGLRAHYQKGEKPCRECREAGNRRGRDKRAKLKPDPSDYDLVCEVPTNKFPFGRRGTNAGFASHRIAEEPPCEECKEGNKEYNRNRMRKNYSRYKDKKIAYQKEYRDLKREEIREKDRDYYVRNKMAYRDRKKERIKILKSMPSDGHTMEDITREHGTLCYLCLDEVDLNRGRDFPDSPHIDHVIPVSHPDFPGDILSNVRWTHSRCNIAKNSKLMSELDLPLPSPVINDKIKTA